MSGAGRAAVTWRPRAWPITQPVAGAHEGDRGGSEVGRHWGQAARRGPSGDASGREVLVLGRPGRLAEEGCTGVDELDQAAVGAPWKTSGQDQPGGR